MVTMRALPNTKPAKYGYVHIIYIAMICCDLVAQTVIRGHAHMSLHKYALKLAIPVGKCAFIV